MADTFQAIISLKNIYRLLKDNDYPIWSDGVFSRKDKKGMTLTSFWHQILNQRWKSTLHGKKIWRQDGTRNRSLSELCNRKESFAFYREYFEEIAGRLGEEEMLAQVSAFWFFLEERHYRMEALHRKLGSFLDAARQREMPYGRKAADWLAQAVSESRKRNVPDHFIACWLLAWMALLAIAGPQMDSPKAQLLQGREELKPEELYERFLKHSRKPAKKKCLRPEKCRITILTDPECPLWQNTLPRRFFFGREKELFDLREICIPGEKVLLCGEDGVGKTELLRQFLQDVTEGGSFPRIAAVEMEAAPAASAEGRFRSTLQDRFRSVLQLLDEDKAEETLLVIDGLDERDAGSRALSEIAALPCAVLISSRIREVSGFVSYPLREPDETAAALIFRYHYGKKMTKKEKLQLQQFLQEYGIRKPGMLRELGERAARENCAVKELCDLL